MDGEDVMKVEDVYHAEHMVERMIQRGGTVDFHGARLDLHGEANRLYTPLQQPLIQGIVCGLYEAHRLDSRPTQAPLLRLNRNAHRRAWYSSAKHEIVLPTMRWAMTDTTLAHEVAHACVGAGHTNRASHGQEWRKTFAAVVRDLIGPASSLLLLDALEVGKK